MRASLIGQSLDNSIEDLALNYFGACEFIAQQTRQIVQHMEEAGHNIKCIFMSGGQCRNGLLMRLLADCTGLPIVIPRYIDAAVVFGSALLGAVAAEESVIDHRCNGPHSKRAKLLADKGGVQEAPIEIPESPYTAPTATSTTNLATIAYAHSNPNNVDYFNQPTQQNQTRHKTDDQEDSDDENTFVFCSKTRNPKGFITKIGQFGFEQAIIIN